MVIERWNLAVFYIFHIWFILCMLQHHVTKNKSSMAIKYPRRWPFLSLVKDFIRLPVENFIQAIATLGMKFEQTKSCIKRTSADIYGIEFLHVFLVTVWKWAVGGCSCDLLLMSLGYLLSSFATLHLFDVCYSLFNSSLRH